jgi:hypothetical protein
MTADFTPELHRPVATDRIPQAGMTMEVKAAGDEHSAVAGRLELPQVKELSCRFVLTRPLAGATRRREGEIVAEGHLRAVLVRECVVSLELFDAVIDERFRVRFVPAGSESDDDDPEADDEIPYDGAAIDLGEAAVEQLALTLDPYPRKPGAELPPEAIEIDFGPFAALARLAKKD